MVVHLISSSIGQAANWSFSEEVRENFAPGKQKGRKQSLTKLGPCKKCEGFVVDKGSFYGCSNYQKNQCNFTISKKILGKNITQKNIKLLLSEGKTELIEGFTNKEKTFNARLYLDEAEKKVKFLFEQTASK
jgi:DNA topoisomerase-3